MNWFEGGRRITTLLQTLIGVGGLAAIFIGGPGAVTFEASRPDEDFAITYNECDFPDRVRGFGPVEIRPGKSRYVRLCFRTSPQGMIAHRRAPDAVVIQVPPPAGTPVTVRINTERTRRSYYYVDPYSGAALDYMERRVNIFRQADTYREVAANHLNVAQWRAYWSRFEGVLPWLLGLWFGLWVLSSVIGWIARGFAGVRSGEDHRPTSASA